MTKDKALHAWFSQFLPAYPASNVPEDAIFPWLTYELVTGAWDSGEIGLTVNLAALHGARILHRTTTKTSSDGI